MKKKLPHITISIARDASQKEVSSDLSSLCIGLGLFLCWFFLTALSCGATQALSGSLPLLFPIGPEAVPVLGTSTLVSAIACLLFVAVLHQDMLHFYVSRRAPVLATILQVAGTGLLCVPAAAPLALPWVAAAGVAVGVGGALGIVLWGTAFAHGSFSTIVLNTVIGLVLALALSSALVNLVPSPFGALLVAASPLVASHLLWRLMPTPYFKRHEAPAFKPLRHRRFAFALRLGLPSLVFGIPFGSLQTVCLGGILPWNSVATQLAVFGGAMVALLFIVAIVVLSKSVSHWDIVFRCTMPVIAGALFALPYLAGESELVATFFVVCGFVCLESIMWIMYADLSQEFSLSPLFVFGVGNGNLLVGVLAADLLITPLYGEVLATPQANGFALLLLLVLVFGYAILPRQREIAAIVRKSHALEKARAMSLETAIPIPFPLVLEDYLSEKLAELGAPSDHAAAILDSLPEELGEPPREKGAESERTQGRFQARCDEIAQAYLLSRRETEVMRLLAKGHNAASIQEKLCISRSTAKTHINHIYKKMDIHTQQELLSMVDERGKGKSKLPKRPIATATIFKGSR